jgi:hypothetical protein
MPVWPYHKRPMSSFLLIPHMSESGRAPHPLFFFDPYEMPRVPKLPLNLVRTHVENEGWLPRWGQKCQ